MPRKYRNTLKSHAYAQASLGRALIDLASSHRRIGPAPQQLNATVRQLRSLGQRNSQSGSLPPARSRPRLSVCLH